MLSKLFNFIIAVCVSLNNKDLSSVQYMLIRSVARYYVKMFFQSRYSTCLIDKM